MERRIFGIESEYGVTCVSPNGQRRLSPDEVARYMFRRVVAWGRSSNVFIKTKHFINTPVSALRTRVEVNSFPKHAPI